MNKITDEIIQKVNFSIKNSSFVEAESLLNNAIKEGNFDYRAYFLLGTLYIKFNKLDLAEINLRKSLELNENFFNSFHNLAVVLNLKKKFSEAQLFFEKALELEPCNLESLIELGRNYELMNKFSEAKEKYQKVLKLNPNNKTANGLIGRMLINLGFHRDGLKHIRKSQGLIRFNQTSFEIIK